MLILTLHQPYATLAILGLKGWETRNRRTNVRGEIGIHASANMPRGYKSKLFLNPFREVLKERSNIFNNPMAKGITYHSTGTGIFLPMGCILGTVNLTDCETTSKWVYDHTVPGEGIQDDFINHFMFGDFSDGRFAWEFQNPNKFDIPIPAKGSQGWWKYDLKTSDAFVL